MNYTLALEFSGDPLPTEKWTKDGIDLTHDEERIEIDSKPGSSTLMIKNAIEDDSGLYQCTITNMGGEESFSANLNVRDCNCGENGTCTLKNLNKICVCDDGYSNQGGKCKKHGDCYKCGENEICEGGKCECPNPFMHDKETKKCQLDLCQLYNTYCSSSMQCKDIGHEGITCDCEKDEYYDGEKCAKLTCEKDAVSRCEQTCSINGTCDCIDGYTLMNDGIRCEKNENYTCNKTCPSGYCYKHGTEEKCKCSPMFIERNDKCMDKCEANEVHDFCPDNKCASLKSEGFHCECTGNWKLSSNGLNCEKIPLCSIKSNMDKCKSFSAMCVDNWRANNFECNCRHGYSKDVDGICKKPCDIIKHKLKCEESGGVCYMDEFGANKCKCPPLLTNGKNNACEERAKFSYFSTFPVKKSVYMTSSSSMQINYDKLGNDLRSSMMSLYGDNYGFADVIQCKVLRDVLRCHVELQFKKHPLSLSTISDPSVCIKDESDSCFVPPRLFLNLTELPQTKIYKTDPCDKDIVESLCGKHKKCSKGKDGNEFLCLCADGFREEYKTKRPPIDELSYCEDIDECENDEACPTPNKCVNEIGGYRCECPNGYRKSDENAELKNTSCIGVCNPNPCKNGECSQIDENGYFCKCKAGYTGKDCSEGDAVLKQAHSKITIVGAVLGTILGIVIIAFFITVKRLKKRKEQDYNPAIHTIGDSEMVERHQIRPGVSNRGFQRD